MAEHLHAREPQRVAGFNLRSRHGLETGTDDLGRVGAEVDRECNERGCHRIEADTQAGQSEEDDEELHEKRRIADHLDITGYQGPEPGPPIDARRGAQGANRQPGDHGYDGEQQGDADAFRDVAPLDPDVAKIEGVFHRPCANPPDPAHVLHRDPARWPTIAPRVSMCGVGELPLIFPQAPQLLPRWFGLHPGSHR